VRFVTGSARDREEGTDLREQLDALREVLHAISVSPFDLDGVLNILVERMSKLCDADVGIIYLPSGEGQFIGVAGYAVNPEHWEYERTHPTPITQGTMVGRVVLSGEPAQVVDAETDPSYTWKEGRKLGGFRTIAGWPIRKEGKLIGTVGLARFEVRRFSDAQVELVRAFADQAAIVIDNVRLAGTIERQREELAQYLPSTVAELISSPDGEALLAGHRREISAVFCDLRGFTAFAEAAEPEEVFDVIREYHRELGAIIVAHGATLEHFAGDGLMIFLNDPKAVADHPAVAVRMAVEMQRRFAAMSDRWRRLGYELGLGIGISVGHATLGRVGFEGHYGYAVIGSVANLASRLCALAEPGQIVMSGRVYALVESIVEATSRGAIELKGFRRPIDVYELVGLSGG
jgi:class 3 adenylate cyclase